jgi:hypothetical protein
MRAVVAVEDEEVVLFRGGEDLHWSIDAVQP